MFPRAWSSLPGVWRLAIPVVAAFFGLAACGGVRPRLQANAVVAGDCGVRVLVGAAGRAGAWPELAAAGAPVAVIDLLPEGGKDAVGIIYTCKGGFLDLGHLRDPAQGHDLEEMGLAGALIGMGIPEDEAKDYENRFNEGEILVLVEDDTLDIPDHNDRDRFTDNDPVIGDERRTGGIRGSRDL